jgi:adenylyltransferase/sulfurtransferase
MNSPFALDRVARARMMVVGCGALGNEVLKHLALLGVGHVVIVDFDRVEADNLSRSVLFTADDAKANRPKVAVVAERLRQMNPRMEVTAIEGDVAYDVGLGLIRQMDVVIGCVDNRWARYCINRLAMRAGIPWVDGGIDVMEGTVRVFVPGKNCYACNLGSEGLKDMTRRLSCAGVIRRNIEAGKTPTTSVIASVIGAVQVQEALKLLCEDSLRQGELTSLCGSMFYYEGQHLTTRLVRFQAYDDDCPVHERWDPVRPVALTKDTTVADALQLLQEELQIPAVSIGLTDDCFVDYVERRDNDRRRQVMRPGRAVAAFVEQDRELCGLPFSALYQHEWRQVDNQFPYQQLTLAELGLPAQAVLPVSSLLKTYYIEIR